MFNCSGARPPELTRSRRQDDFQKSQDTLMTWFCTAQSPVRSFQSFRLQCHGLLDTTLIAWRSWTEPGGKRGKR